MKIMIMLAGIAIAIFLLGWIGLHIKPAAFSPYAQPTQAPKTVPFPKGLPAPVERYYRQLFGEEVPVIETAVITGRGSIRPVVGGPRIPIRFRYTHVAGQKYRHYIEMSVFGLPVAKVNEYYVDQKERMEMPWGTFEDVKLDESGCLGMWAEIFEWLPARLLTDPQVRWEPVDEATALMVVPCGKLQEKFVVRFEPGSGKLLYWEIMRYRDAADTSKMLWINGTWFDQGSPWAVFDAEQVVFNVPVEVSLTAKGE